MYINEYIGCIITFKDRKARIIDATDCYEGLWYTLEYEDGETEKVDAFDYNLMEALPDPCRYELRNEDEKVIFTVDENEYELSSHPYEPCLYIKKDGEIIRTLHNAFEVYDLAERFENDETLLGIDGKSYGGIAFYRILEEAISQDKTENNFTEVIRM